MRDPARFIVAICGRRGGKTVVGQAKIIRKALEVPGSFSWFIGPTLDDSRALFYEPVLELLEPYGLVRSKNGTRQEIRLVNGSRMQGVSADKPKRGRRVDLAVCDEFAWWDGDFEAIWQGEIRPALSDSKGEALFITTPAGFNWAYDYFMRGHSAEFPDWGSHMWTTLEGGWVAAEEIAAARHGMDERIFAQEFLASFETLSGTVYSNFDRHLNVERVEDTGAEVLVGMDFNVNPMSAVIGVRMADELHIIHEVELLTSNTEEMAEVLKDDWPGRQIIVCPDPSGKARKTSAPAGQTDFSILRRAGFDLRAPNKAPLVRDRINYVQAMLLNADGRRRLKVHPRCKKLIKALDGLTYRQGTNQPDKNSGLDHITDALGYLVAQEFGPSRTLQIGHLAL